MSDIDGKNAVSLTHFHAFTGTPRWSPDGKRIVFDSRESGAAAIYLVDAEERVPRKTHTEFPECQPTWSRDGQYIYFNSCDREETALYKTSLGTEKVIRVTTGSGLNAWEAADGSTYYVTAETGGVIRRIPEGGRPDQPVPSMPRMQYAVDWALGANGIYFLDRTAAPIALRFYEFKTQRITKLLALKNPVPIWGGISVSPDEKMILYSQRDEASSVIMLVEGFK